MAAGLSGLLVRHEIFSPSPLVVAIQSFGAGLAIWSRVVLGRRSFTLSAEPTSGRLVTAGPYRIIRHPVYTAACIILFAGIAYHRSLFSIGCGVLILAGALLRIREEEKRLAAAYPEFRDYALRTWRMIPFVY
ncbi:MAG: isoprenylcysteine carboxylmethyltransferase family protein [Nitrospiraceae bacterium]|nr:isoprenylcysteine carboxylmethyltransferase family protein [Nitrospiraceae bacterium]